MSNQDVVITGRSLITASGINEESWRALVEGKSAAKWIDLPENLHWHASRLPGAEIPKDFWPAALIGQEPKESRRMGLGARLAAVTARLALRDAGLWNHSSRSKFPFIVSVALGDFEFITEGHEWLYEKQRALGLAKMPMALINMGVHNISQVLDMHGLGFATTTACASGITGLFQGALMIKAGYADVVVVIGAEGIVLPQTLVLFNSLGVLGGNQRDLEDPKLACLPFAQNRDGFLFGDGGGAIVLESREHAEARKAHIEAKVLGFGHATEGHSIVEPSSEKLYLADAIAEALQRSEISQEEVDYFLFHGSGTLAGDRVETRSFKHVFNQHAYNVPIGTNKHIFGHTMGASGIVSLWHILNAMEEKVIPPAIVHTEPLDPQCDLDYVDKVREVTVNIAGFAAMGLGGSNAVGFVKKM